MATLKIDIWSDIMCPFCYLGDSMLQEALKEFPNREDVEIRYHSYQLMPELTEEPADLSEILGKRYGAEQMKAQQDHLTERGKEAGITYNFEKQVAVSTRKAHELSHFAAEHGKGHEVMLGLFKAHFSEGINVADVAELVKIAVAAGLDGSAAKAALESGKYASQVDQDIQSARQMGVQGVPFFVFAEKYAVSGAQPKEMFAQALTTAWAERS